MRRITAVGASNGFLPPYQVKLDVLGSEDIVKQNDLVLIGKSEDDFHAWTKVEASSPFIGETVVSCHRMFGWTGGFSRRVE
jgi:hypothetical protein